MDLNKTRLVGFRDSDSNNNEGFMYAHQYHKHDD